MITKITESKTLTQLISCLCKSEFNSDQKGNKE